jgi:hypothetical protein
MWLPSWGNGSEIVFLAGHLYNERFVWAIATGQDASRYSQINMTSCEAFFDLIVFKIDVDAVSRTINVSVSGNATQCIEPGLGSGSSKRAGSRVT